MTNKEIADLLAKCRRARVLVKEVRVEMLRVCVEELGMDQKDAKEHQLEDFLDGYLVGQGVRQAWREVSKDSE